MTTAKRQAIVLRDFNDAGTEEAFTASDEPVAISEGAFLNYEAAGLVKAAPDKLAKGDKPAGDKPA